jgi:hypothetical protein
MIKKNDIRTYTSPWKTLSQMETKFTPEKNKLLFPYLRHLQENFSSFAEEYHHTGEPLNQPLIR